MTILSKIKDSLSGRVARVVEDDLPGLIVYPQTRPEFATILEARNSEGSSNLNVDGSPNFQELIFDGGDTAAWNGNATGNVVLSSPLQANTGSFSTYWPDGSVSSEAQYTIPSGSIIPSSNSRISAAIYLDTVVPASEYEVRLRLGGSNQTPWIDYTSVVNTGIIGAWQNIDIPFSLIGSTPEFDEIRFRKRNSSTVFFLDDINFVNVVGNNTFTLVTIPTELNNTPIQINEFTLFLSLNEDSTLNNAALENLSATNFGGAPGLTNGLSISRQGINTVDLTFTIRDNGDVISRLAPNVQTGGNDTNQWVAFTWTATSPVRYLPASEDAIIITVNDDLTAFERIFFTGKGVIREEDIS